MSAQRSRVSIGAIALAALLGGCGSDAPREAPRPDRTSDKRALYADAVLVPTREGEEVRREVALAGQIEAAIEVALDTAAVSADVELEDDPPRVAVALRMAAPDPDAEASRSIVQSLARAIVKDATVSVVHTAPPPEIAGPPAPARISAGLVLALLGLGVSLGITIERLRLRVARRRRR